MVDDKPDRVNEMVWTGRSDRRVLNRAEIYEPRKIARARSVYETTKDGETFADKIPTETPAAKAARPAPAAAKPAAPPPAKPAPQAAKPAAPLPAKPRPQAAKSAAPAPAKAAVQPARPQPKPAVALDTGSVRQNSRFIAKAVVGSFVDRMKQEAQRKGGSLSLKDIESLDQEFEQKTAALEALFEKTFKEYARSAGRREERRQTPFDRLIVTPIEHLLPGRGSATPAKGGLSRRILPGFFMAVTMMMGADVTEQCRERAKAIFDRVNGGTDSPDWKAFASDPEARVLATDALVAMAVHFANPDKRAAWVIDMINNHLSPADSEPDTAADWRLGRPAYERMIDALFSEIMEAVNNAKAREALTLRYGPETCASLVTIMKGLGA